MEVYKCNVCGKTANRDNQVYTLWLIGPIDRLLLNYDRKWPLCPSCFRKFKKFMKVDTEGAEK